MAPQRPAEPKERLGEARVKSKIDNMYSSNTHYKKLIIVARRIMRRKTVVVRIIRSKTMRTGMTVMFLAGLFLPYAALSGKFPYARSDPYLYLQKTTNPYVGSGKRREWNILQGSGNGVIKQVKLSLR